MAITWKTRGAGKLLHRYHPLTDEQVAAVKVPGAPGIHTIKVAGQRVFGIAAHTPMLRDRPLLLGPVVYATLDDAETHAEAWLTRDRDVFHAERGIQ